MKYEILEKSETVDFSVIGPMLRDFISKFVLKNRKERWFTLINKPKQLRKKFGDLWDHLETERSVSLNIENIPNGVWFYYDGSDDFAYKLKTSELIEVCTYTDGITFFSSGNIAIFFTHEGSEYLFKI